MSTEMILRSKRILLRPFRPDEVEVLWQAQKRLRTRPGMNRPDARHKLRKRIERSGRFVNGFLDLAVEAEGRLVGEIDARRPKRALPPGVFELGIALFDPTDRGRGYGSEAVELLVGYLFRDEAAERIQASTAVSNAAMRRVFEKLGFAFEGVLRGFMPSEDGREDYALYG